jgi:negative regulator of flagellin synthesis FlgM
MKINSSGLPATPVVVATPVVTAPSAASPVASASEAASADGAMLQGARAALKDMPEIDAAKVAAVRDALAKGEITFDPAKLAGLIARYHGSKG